MLGTVLVFFPYQKALRIVSQNLMGSSSMTVALEGPRFGFASVQVSRIVVGHVAVQGKPLFELKKIDARWYPFSLLTGKLAIFCRAVAYDGTIECSIDGIPVFAKVNPICENQIRERKPGKVSGRDASMVQRHERKAVGLDQGRSSLATVQRSRREHSG